MGQTRRRGLRELAKGPMGPWELRPIPVDHEGRPELGDGREFWRPECYLNNRYSVSWSVFVCELGEVDHLWIRRHDGDPARSWADLQAIKNHVLGDERVALEVFPAVSQLVDAANMYHLWSPPAGFSLPFAARY